MDEDTDLKEGTDLLEFKRTLKNQHRKYLKNIFGPYRGLELKSI